MAIDFSYLGLSINEAGGVCHCAAKEAEAIRICAVGCLTRTTPPDNNLRTAATGTPSRAERKEFCAKRGTISLLVLAHPPK